MPAAIVFRGHAHRGRNEPDGGNAHGIDWRLCVESQKKFLIDPAYRYHDVVDVYLTFYDRPNRSEIINSYYTSSGGPPVWQLADSGASQGQTFRKALAPVEDPDRYDLVLVTRFDLEFLCTPWELPNFEPDKVNFLWREYCEETWRNHNRVPDAVHMLPGKLLPGFLRGCHASLSEGCMHLIYRPVCEAIGPQNVNVMSDEYVNSSSDVQSNPVYRMVRL